MYLDKDTPVSKRSHYDEVALQITINREVMETLAALIHRIELLEKAVIVISNREVMK